jgi:hypothetical protein
MVAVLDGATTDPAIQFDMIPRRINAGEVRIPLVLTIHRISGSNETKGLRIIGCYPKCEEDRMLCNYSIGNDGNSPQKHGRSGPGRQLPREIACILPPLP